MPDIFAIYSGMVVTASGTTPVLWPNVGFPSSGPTPEFLAANSAQKVLTTLPFNPDTQKLSPIAPYRLNGETYNVEVVALTAAELAAVKLSKDTAAASASAVGLDYRYAAELRAKGDDTSRLDAYDYLLKKGLPPWP